MIPLWMKTVSADDVDLKTLAGILSLDQDDPRLMEAALALCHALRVQMASGSGDTDLAALKEQVASLEKALARISTVLGEMPNAKFLDEHYFLANDDMQLLQLGLDGQAGSGFEIMVERLSNAVADYKAKSLASPGKGRRRDKTYTMAINSLADFFESTFPEHRLTHHKRTVFANFVTFWLEGFSDADPQRHIKTALETRPS